MHVRIKPHLLSGHRALMRRMRSKMRRMRSKMRKRMSIMRFRILLRILRMMLMRFRILLRILLRIRILRIKARWPDRRYGLILTCIFLQGLIVAMKQGTMQF